MRNGCFSDKCERVYFIRNDVNNVIFNSHMFVIWYFPAFLFLYYLISKFHSVALSKNYVIAFSIVFLFMNSTITPFSWYALFAIVYLPLAAVINYYVAKGIRKAQRKRIWIGALIIFNLLPLVYFKYLEFFMRVISPERISGYDFHKIIVPIGISFFVFQQISFIVDSSRGKTEDCTLRDHIFTSLLFTKMTSGPITR